MIVKSDKASLLRKLKKTKERRKIAKSEVMSWHLSRKKKDAHDPSHYDDNGTMKPRPKMDAEDF